MNRRIILATLMGLLLAAAVSAAAGTMDQFFDAGNKFYTDGAYDKAVVEYEKILATGYQSPELYFNLGNAYFRNGQLGKAIMNYVRAQRLDPRDDDIKANLRFARQFAIDKIEVTEETILLDYINRFFDYFSLKEITWMTFVLYLATAVVFLGGFIYKRIRMPVSVLIVLLAFLVATSLLTAVKINRDYAKRTGVILDQQAEVKNGPASDSKMQFLAHAGLTFTIEREESGYYLVNFANRLKGWIAKTAVAEI